MSTSILALSKTEFHIANMRSTSRRLLMWMLSDQTQLSSTSCIHGLIADQRPVSVYKINCMRRVLYFPQPLIGNLRCLFENHVLSLNQHQWRTKQADSLNLRPEFISDSPPPQVVSIPSTPPANLKVSRSRCSQLYSTPTGLGMYRPHRLRPCI